MKKWEKYLMYGIPIIGGVALAYYLLTRPSAPAALPPTAPPAPEPAVGVPSYTGVPATDPRGTLLAMAEQQCGLTGDSVVIRGLRSQDFGLANWNHTSTGANVWDNFASATVGDCTFIALTGISYSGSNFSQMRVQAGSSYVAYPSLAFISGLVSQIYFFPQPVYIEQNNPVVIDIIAKAVATEGVSLIGMVAEKKGVLISP